MNDILITDQEILLFNVDILFCCCSDTKCLKDARGPRCVPCSSGGVDIYVCRICQKGCHKGHEMDLDRSYRYSPCCCSHKDPNKVINVPKILDAKEEECLPLLHQFKQQESGQQDTLKTNDLLHADSGIIK